MSQEAVLELKHAGYIYGKDTVYEVTAVRDVSFTITKGEFIGVLGHTGSGKSTMVQLLNGLLKPTEGEVFFHGENIHGSGFDLRRLRTRVGLVFQYPEHQLFETDLLSDVMFGPKNQGLSKEECAEKARQALAKVGIPEELYGESPFELSGGQKRRAAIAGVLAMEPEVLILDEPTAGLDPSGRDEILDQVKDLQKEGISILLVTHSMEDAARYADRLLIMNDGTLTFDGTPREAFRHPEELEAMGLAAPEIVYVMRDLEKAGLPVDPDAMTVEEAKQSILSALQKRNG